MNRPGTLILISITLFNSVFGVFRKSKESVLSKSVSADQADNVDPQDHRVPPGLISPVANNGGFGQTANGGPPPQFGPPPNFDGVPPNFEKVLPEDVLHKMRELHRNQKIPVQQKQVEFDRIMSAVPTNILAKLPLPPGFEMLPEEIQTQIRNIHSDSNLNWTQKTEKVHQLIQSLPPDQHPRPPVGFPPLAPPGATHTDFFPPNPPPGFEKVIPPDTYQQLLDIHRNPALSPQEKGKQIDQIMRSLPQDIVDQLPLPPGFEQLPENELKKAKAIFGDRSLSFKEKDRRVFEFVKSLPTDLRRLVRPPLPPVFERLSTETKDKIVNLFDDETLDDQQRQKRFRELISGLQKDEKSTVQDALNVPI